MEPLYGEVTRRRLKTIEARWLRGGVGRQYAPKECEACTQYTVHVQYTRWTIGSPRRCMLKRVEPSTVDTKRPPPSARPRSPGMALRATRPSRPPSGEWRSGCNYQRARWCANRKSASGSNPPGTPSPVRARVAKCGPPPTPPRNLWRERYSQRRIFSASCMCHKRLVLAQGLVRA